ncbi:hypothetical protein IPJ70_04290 [Candidatus Campbellbacteria bacterium]|nr:MAG: hypothetical protein IPJ70_04290 [Candidatus Campbellbacteria bacterium]
MQTNNKNKMIGKDDVKNKQEYFFSGGQEYLPQTIRADSQKEAERVWKESRVKVKKPLQENN